MDGRVIGVMNRGLLIDLMMLMVRLFVAVASGRGRYQRRRFHQHHGTRSDGDRRRCHHRRSVLDDRAASSATTAQHLICTNITESFHFCLKIENSRVS